jgi:hypothetical protein
MKLIDEEREVSKNIIAIIEGFQNFNLQLDHLKFQVFIGNDLSLLQMNQGQSFPSIQLPVVPHNFHGLCNLVLE